ncbi:BlaI/MecI/CopY family transcriptional regulator [Flavihumibacter petaseus]|uniref:Putative BlaI family transcriptional regulator n=1 Tax=Flavihumibacter petaseus NBRC 106054 TaxID=1220578 RepID=A0A0E9N442_9BACT|nr:BlaI/MecI/CopY family transcriptional regulator [Flavihumibacter petaseus]GAO44594.1 putative BlaI family transcriptional regulator [Flavihumibacter petaseus NBRC 106054]
MEMKLTRSEEEIMQVLWELEQGFLKDIIDRMPSPKPHSNTVATLLKILVEKGFVRYSVHGRNNLYEPVITKTAYGRKSVQQVLKGYFDGSAANLVSQFLREDKLSIEEMETLLKTIKSAKKK